MSMACHAEAPSPVRRPFSGRLVRRVAPGDLFLHASAPSRRRRQVRRLGGRSRAPCRWTARSCRGCPRRD